MLMPAKTRPRASLRGPRGARSSAARERLIDAALDLFAARGFEATSTRAIATRAKVNLAAIPYYFRGKEGLYRAVAEHIASELNALVGGERERVLEMLHRAPLSPAQARAAMHALIERLAAIIVSSDAARWAPFILREQMQPTSAFGVLYESFMEPTHRALSALLAAATGNASDSAETCLRVFTLIGQVLVFRAARSAVLRRLGWPQLEAHELKQIMAVLHANLDRLTMVEARP
jgi:AcrR family transcriptional regulator